MTVPPPDGFVAFVIVYPLFENVHDIVTLLDGIVNVHLFAPAAEKDIPVAVGVFAVYPVPGIHVIVTVSPICAVDLLLLAVPPVPAFTVML